MIHIIFNPNSGSNSQQFNKKIISKLKQIPNSILHFTEYGNHASKITSDAISENANKIIVVGGDGTINEVASQLVNQSIPLGIIPMGSGNGLARHLKIPLNFEKALYKCLNGSATKIDVIYFNEKAFFCTAGIGFDAVVAHEFAKSKKRGFINYIIASFNSIKKFQTINIQSEEMQEAQIFSLTFANANQFGNNAYISPNSNLQDGEFEIITIKALNLIEVAELGIRLFLKNISTHKKVHISSRKMINFKAKIGTPIHLDGENLFIEKETNQILIHPKALNIVV